MYAGVYLYSLYFIPMTSTFIRHKSCDNCGSSDANAVYRKPNGELYSYCYSCNSSGGGSAPLPFYPPHLFGHTALEFRRLTKATCVKFNVTYHKGCVAFPYYRGNKVVYVKYRDFLLFNKGERGHVFSAGRSSKTFFGWNAVHTKDTIGIVYGEFDAMAVTQVTGVPCLSPPNGDGTLVSAIKADYDRLSQFKNIILVPDLPTGNESININKVTEEAAKLLGQDRVRIVNLSLKDPNEYLMTGQEAMLKKAFWSAQPATTDLFFSSAAEVIEPTGVGIMTGVMPIDRYMGGLRRGETTYVLGAPVRGKTTWVQTLMYHLYHRGVKMMPLILEGKASGFMTPLANMFAGGNLWSLSPEERKTLAEGMDSQILVARCGGMTDIETIRRTVQAGVRAHGVQVVLVDNITAATVSLDSASTDNRASANKLVILFDQLATELDVHIVVISHVGRQAYDEAPTLGSGSDTSLIEKLAYNVIGIHRDPSSSITKISILKSRRMGAYAIKSFTGTLNEQGVLVQR